jgi:hypothetical protein
MEIERIRTHSVNTRGTSTDRAAAWMYGAQKLHELFVDLGRGFVLHPVTHIVDLEISDETGEASAEFVD